MSAILYYIHDPMCSWCWGYRPAWDNLQANLPGSISVEYVAGGLAPDSDVPMPAAQQKMISAHWQTIQDKLGTQFNFDFWQKNTPRRSTYNSCRAAIAAGHQGFQKEMIQVIQHAYYLRALNPSDIDVLIMLAKELSEQKFSDSTSTAFDLARFTQDLTSVDTQQGLNHHIQLARELTNQGFPSLVLECNEARYQIPINYKNYKATLADITSIIEK